MQVQVDVSMPSTSRPRKKVHVLKFLGPADPLKITILLICDQKEIAARLAKELVKLSKPFKVDVHVTKSLPLRYEDHPDFDFVVFMIDISKRSSKQNIDDAILLVDISYFLGRSCFVAVNSNVPMTASCDVDEIAELEDIYNVPVFRVFFDNNKSVECLAERVMNAAEFAANKRSGLLNPAYIASVGNKTMSDWSLR